MTRDRKTRYVKVSVLLVLSALSIGWSGYALVSLILLTSKGDVPWGGFAAVVMSLPITVVLLRGLGQSMKKDSDDETGV